MASSERDWVAWHEPYDQPGSSLARRLEVVQNRIAAALEQAPPGPIRVISMCAGHGRDLLGALADHARAIDVTARLVELDPRNVVVARQEAARHPAVEVVCRDASNTSAYEGAVPADLVLACGVFGNITYADIRRTIAALPQLCSAGAVVIWTRHRKSPDLTPTIRAWFTESGFDEVGFDSAVDTKFGVGTNRLAAPPQPFEPGIRLFDFIGDGRASNL